MTEFDEFYLAYPNKKAKPVARKAWDKAVRIASPEDIMAGLARYIEGKEPWKAWLMPATFLNQERWDDDYTDSDDQRLREGLFAATVAREPSTGASGGREQDGGAGRPSGGSTLFGSGRASTAGDHAEGSVVHIRSARQLGGPK